MMSRVLLGWIDSIIRDRAIFMMVDARYVVDNRT